MGLFKYAMGKSKEGFQKLYVIHYSGLPTFPDGAPCDMIINEDENAIVFKSPLNKKIPSVTLPFEKVTFAGYENLLESRHQSKADSAVTGGLLFGKTGAMIGAMTNDDKKFMQKLLVIKYTSDDEEKSIILKESANLNTGKFHKRLQQFVPTDFSDKSGDVTL